MEKMKDMFTTVTVIICFQCLLVCSSLVSAFPGPSVNIPSTNALRHTEQSGASPTMHLADGILCDLMMANGDRNRDGKLSESEITWFYLQIVQYPPYVAERYGRAFIDIADTDNDGLLNRSELLLMIVEMDAIVWTKR